MDSPSAVAANSSSRLSPLARAGVLAAFLAYGIFLAFHVGAYAGGSDSSGYLNSARLLAHGATATPQRVPPGLDPAQLDLYAFVPLGFIPLQGHRLVPNYPIGVPLGLAATARVIGWRFAPPLFMLACALAAVALIIPLGRAAGLPVAWSIFGAFLFGASPLTTFMSLQLMSDIPATAAATATILCAWYGRSRRPWALLAGFSLAVAVLVRPSNLLLVAPVALCLGLDWRRWLLLGLGGLPGGVCQLIYNAVAYGNPLTSGYGSFGHLFTLAVIPPTLAHYVHWLPILLTPIGVLALAFPWLARRALFTWVLVLWVIVIFGFYTPYWHTHETWWFLRFLLPAFPAAIVGGLWVLHAQWLKFSLPLPSSPRVTRSLALAAVVGLLLFARFWHVRLGAHDVGRAESIYPEASIWTTQHLPADATIFAMQMSGALTYYTQHPVVRWDSIKAVGLAQITRAALGQKRPLYAVLFPFEVPQFLALGGDGQWMQIGAVREVTLWQWRPAP